MPRRLEFHCTQYWGSYEIEEVKKTYERNDFPDCVAIFLQCVPIVIYRYIFVVRFFMRYWCCLSLA